MSSSRLKKIRSANQKRVLAKAIEMLTREERNAMRAWAKGEAVREGKQNDMKRLT